MVGAFVVLDDVPGVVFVRCFAADFKFNSVRGEPGDVFTGTFDEILVLVWDRLNGSVF